LAPIVAAFAAGILLDEAYFESFRDRGEHRLDELLQPVGAALIPIFFVWMGLKVDLTADTALRLARYFGTSPDFWMNLQAAYELDLARKKLGAAIKRIPQRKHRRPSEAQP
jgi:hypothetical protein